MSRDVLVVDDDPDMADVMVLMLAEAGYQTRRAGNGKEALEAAAADRPALVVLDMLMPVMDGWQCARELRALYGRGLPIVVATAAEHARARSEEVGADDALPKPFEMGDLLRVVERYLSAG
jgi:CheY-like chemotaxis protein